MIPKLMGSIQMRRPRHLNNITSTILIRIGLTLTTARRTTRTTRQKIIRQQPSRLTNRIMLINRIRSTHLRPPMSRTIILRLSISINKNTLSRNRRLTRNKGTNTNMINLANTNIRHPGRDRKIINSPSTTINNTLRHLIISRSHLTITTRLRIRLRPVNPLLRHRLRHKRHILKHPDTHTPVTPSLDRTTVIPPLNISPHSDHPRAQFRHSQ